MANDPNMKPEDDDSDDVSKEQWVGLLAICSTGIVYMWQKFGMTYAYGFRGIDENCKNPFYELSTAYPQILENYSFLSGAAILAPAILLGLFVGKLSDSVNRKWLLGLTCLVWSASTVVAGSIESYEVFSAMRISLGIFSVAAVTPALSLIRDLVPPNFRSRAVGLYLSSDAIGCAISSLSILLIETVGWRGDYELTGAFGLMAGLAMLIFVKEPERGRYDRQLSAENNE